MDLGGRTGFASARMRRLFMLLIRIVFISLVILMGRELLLCKFSNASNCDAADRISGMNSILPIIQDNPSW